MINAKIRVTKKEERKNFRSCFFILLYFSLTKVRIITKQVMRRKLIFITSNINSNQVNSFKKKNSVIFNI
jgi:hypothetical protein